MHSKLFYSILLLCFAGFCRAQNSTAVLDTAMFNQNWQRIGLTGLDGWLFKEGSDTSWAAKDLDTKGWKKFNPYELTVKNADKNGRVEGWFRLRFRLNNSFLNFPMGISSNRFAASDVYIDGQQVASFGNTGLDGNAYQEYQGSLYPTGNLNLEVNVDHVLALHLVDYRSPLNSFHLKTQENADPGGYYNLIAFAGPNANSKFIFFIKDFEVYFGIWSSVCGVLSILFWLLYFQNRNEKNLIAIALSTTLLSVSIFFVKMDSLVGTSHMAHVIIFYLYTFLLNIAFSVILYTLARIFKRKISIALLLYLVFTSFAGIIDKYFFDEKLGVFINASSFLVCIYLIVTSWRKLRGAQWSVVAGIVLTFLFGVLYAYNFAKFGRFDYPFVYLHLSGASLSFPFSLLVYVAMRFKEIMNEVRANANEVVKITEEKKELLAHQNELLEKQVEERTSELKASQSQLIQSEKMASLGELTAGIAHEIQNPLNFVNNFSEVNTELIDELSREIETGNLKEVRVLAKDIKENEQKINHHGKRADAIVKGMLQHSRSSSGVKEPTDINALCDEYLRLCYHGLRAKDKSFNATMKTDFDSTIGNINIIPQDVGRVILNLLTNAFYAVGEKRKLKVENYEPIVSISISKTNGRVEIRVTDNGNGIPDSIKDKIFQPFFTTKPTGQGTGLGLSLSYDIITKGHGGELRVETKEGEGSNFIIYLPVA